MVTEKGKIYKEILTFSFFSISFIVSNHRSQKSVSQCRNKINEYIFFKWVERCGRETQARCHHREKQGKMRCKMTYS